MLSSAKSYVAVSEKVDEDLSNTEENHEEVNTSHSHESRLTNTHSWEYHDNAVTQTTFVTNREVSNSSSNSVEETQEEVEETSDNTKGEEEMSDTQEKTEGLISHSCPGASNDGEEPTRRPDQFQSDKTSFCASPTGSSEGLIPSKEHIELSIEDSDDEFLQAYPKRASSGDLLDKNFVKWASVGTNVQKNNRDKDTCSTIKSDSPCSDVEFSACSSVTSCTGDSGISSTVRDDDLEEIPLNGSRLSPELYKQFSKLSVDESVAAWIPQSSNTYAPSPDAKTINGTDITDGNKSLKQSKLKGLFSKSSQSVQGWKLFGKVPAKEAQENGVNHPSSFDGEDFKQKSVGDKPASTPPNTRPKFLSLKRKATTGSSTTALIFENRPRNLPAKSASEEKKHRKQYEAMVAEAKKKELKDMMLQEKRLRDKCKQEDGIVSAVSLWTSDILPNWEAMQHSKKTRELWWQGLPPSVRGKVWKLAIGNDLHITHELFDIFQSHAYEKLFTTRLNKKNPTKQSIAELPTSDHSVVSKAHTVELIVMDVSRTFPSLCIFQEGGPFHDVLHSILGAYTCYRPDVGYVQGMSFLAAVLLLNMEPSDAFICFANLLNKPCQLAFFRIDHPMMIAYFAAFEMFLEENVPALYQHFIQENFTPDMYLIDWTFTLFSKSLPLDTACRVWDVFCRDGEAFLFRAALGVLKFYQENLLEMDFIHLGQFLSKLPDDIPADLLFQTIASINLTEQKFTQTLTVQKEVAAQIKNVSAATK
ncbi:TBC1 domain family member 14-like [Acropora palmata]|uniref:TBC1 domain family member 14-like n=1 Tax=Acropora palmata TaxID=6131 RepID=UPI003DA0436C